MFEAIALGILASLILLSTAAAAITRRKSTGDGLLAVALGPFAMVAMADTSLVIPANTFYGSAGGLSPKTCTKKVKTVTGIRLGRGVELDTTDEEVKLAAVDTLRAIGVVIKNLTDKTWDGDTDPTAGDVLEILLIGSGEVAVCWTNDDLSLALGQIVAFDASGEVKLIDTSKPLSRVGRVLVGADGSSAAAKVAVVI